jgi:hypothetical protein
MIANDSSRVKLHCLGLAINNQMDTPDNLWENNLVNMGNKARHTKNFVYPESTAGSKAAKRLRTEANKLSEPDRENLFKRGMQIIYGGTGKKEAVGARH